MRIVQIIDSLEPGGAERMAVNYANAISKKANFSALVTTRAEGLLLNQINQNVTYLFLNRKQTIDFKALSKLRDFLIFNKITIIQAHSSSFFIAVLVKLTLPKIKIIWHDHYGISQDLKSRKNVSLRFGSLFFTGIISVNTALKNWAEKRLWCSNVRCFPNFIDEVLPEPPKIELKGTLEKRIICVANLRPQKNHSLLIESAAMLKKEYPDWTFHFLGKDFKDDYASKLKKRIDDLALRDTVFFYGAVDNASSAMQQCDIAVLPSISEGLPLAILEYGLHGLPVVATNVGEVNKVIPSENEGLVVESNNLSLMVNSIKYLIDNKNQRELLGNNLSKFVRDNYAEDSVVKDYIFWLNSLGC